MNGDTRSLGYSSYVQLSGLDVQLIQKYRYIVVAIASPHNEYPPPKKKVPACTRRNIHYLGWASPYYGDVFLDMVTEHHTQYRFEDFHLQDTECKADDPERFRV